MRIGFLTGSIAKIGSGQGMVLPLARALSRQKTTAFGLELSRFQRRQVQAAGLTVWRAPVLSHLVRHPLRFSRILLRGNSNQDYPMDRDGLDGYDLAAGDALLDLIGWLNLDVLYAFHNTNIARVLKGWPHPSRLLIINLIGFGIDPSRGGAKDTFPLQRFVFERPYWDIHVAATRFEYEQYRQVYQRLGLDEDRLIYLPHSYDENTFHPLKPEEINSSVSANGSKTLLYPVNVYPRKNIEMAIDVLAILNRQIDVRLLVPGAIWDSAYHNSLISRARRLGIENKVEFLGGISQDRMVDLFRTSNVTIFTSHQETFGLGIIESLGCGTPVVGPDWIIPCREMLVELPGGATSPKESDAFASKVLEMLGSDHDPQRLASAAQANYGSTVIAERFIKVIEHVKRQKADYTGKIRSTEWKKLYADAGNLL